MKPPELREVPPSYTYDTVRGAIMNCGISFLGQDYNGNVEPCERLRRILAPTGESTQFRGEVFRRDPDLSLASLFQLDRPHAARNAWFELSA